MQTYDKGELRPMTPEEEAEHLARQQEAQALRDQQESEQALALQQREAALRKMAVAAGLDEDEQELVLDASLGRPLKPHGNSHGNPQGGGGR